ncbi:MAG: DUF2796 domain-containing protein [Alcanivoracaceae bacterium]
MKRTGLFVVLCVLAAVATAQRVHVHGQGTVQLALDGKQLDVLLTIPAMDVVGFEHAPANERQQDAVHIAASRLADFGQVIRLPEAAGCTVEVAEVKSPLLEVPAKPAGHRHHHHHHGHHHGQGADDHAEFDGQYRFRCARPEALRQLSFSLFDWLPALTLRAELITAEGASVVTLTQQQPALALPAR